MGLKPRSNSTTVRLSYKDEKSDKFWHITAINSSHTVRFGRVGSGGQSKTKFFASNTAALADARKLVVSKKKKGYTQGKRMSPEWYLDFLRARGLECHIGYELIDYYDSTLLCEGDLQLGEGPDCIVVDGDLHVSETLALSDPCGLFVLGDVHAKEVVTDEGEIRILGRLTAAKRVRLGESGIFYFGSLSTPLLQSDFEDTIENPKHDHMRTTRLGPRLFER